MLELPHNPYELMLDELNFLNNISSENQKQALVATRENLRQVRQGYDFSMEDKRVDYSKEYHRAAYLLAYYPHHIEPIYNVITSLKQPIRQQFMYQQPKLVASFLGPGPGAEALGLLAAAQQYSPETQSCLAYFFDYHHWSIGQNITTALAPNYWSGEKFRIFPVSCDLTNSVQSWSDLHLSFIGHSHLVVMQNCLNDPPGTTESLLSNISNILEMMTGDFVFIIIDVNLSHVKRLMQQIENHVKKEKLGKIARSVKSGVATCTSNIDVPDFIIDHLYAEDDRYTKQRKHTSYYATVIYREEIPF